MYVCHARARKIAAGSGVLRRARRRILDAKELCPPEVQLWRVFVPTAPW